MSNSDTGYKGDISSIPCYKSIFLSDFCDEIKKSYDEGQFEDFKNILFKMYGMMNISAGSSDSISIGTDFAMFLKDMCTSIELDLLNSALYLLIAVTYHQNHDNDIFADQSFVMWLFNGFFYSEEYEMKKILLNVINNVSHDSIRFVENMVNSGFLPQFIEFVCESEASFHVFGVDCIRLFMNMIFFEFQCMELYYEFIGYIINHMCYFSKESLNLIYMFADFSPEALLFLSERINIELFLKLFFSRKLTLVRKVLKIVLLFCQSSIESVRERICQDLCFRTLIDVVNYHEYKKALYCIATQIIYEFFNNQPAINIENYILSSLFEFIIDSMMSGDFKTQQSGVISYFCLLNRLKDRFSFQSCMLNRRIIEQLIEMFDSSNVDLVKETLCCLMCIISIPLDFDQNLELLPPFIGEKSASVNWHLISSTFNEHINERFEELYDYQDLADLIQALQCSIQLLIEKYPPDEWYKMVEPDGMYSFFDDDFDYYT